MVIFTTHPGCGIPGSPKKLCRWSPAFPRASGTSVAGEDPWRARPVCRRATRLPRTARRRQRKLLPKLVRACALDAFEKPTPATVHRPAVAVWLRSANSATCERYGSPGLGDDVRVEGPSLVGAGLVVDGCPVHTELFPEERRERDQRRAERRPATPPTPPPGPRSSTTAFLGCAATRWPVYPPAAGGRIRP